MGSYYNVDILVNNAAQTIRRPAAYYQELIEKDHDLRVDSDRTYLNRVLGDITVCVRDLGCDPWASNDLQAASFDEPTTKCAMEALASAYPSTALCTQPDDSTL